MHKIKKKGHGQPWPKVPPVVKTTSSRAYQYLSKISCHVDEHGKPCREAVPREERGVPRGSSVARRGSNMMVKHGLDGLGSPLGSVVGR